MAGSRVFGLIYDAAGSMQRLFRYLRKKKELPEGAWLPIELVRIQNPYDTSRWIYIYHCSTHNLKNMRGQFWMSKESGPKLFYDAEGHIIGKYIFEDAWLRDEERADINNALRKSDLRQGVIELDKWNKMNTRFAKAPFSNRTLLEIVEHIYLQLGVTRDKIYRVKEHPTCFLAYFSTVAKN